MRVSYGTAVGERKVSGCSSESRERLFAGKRGSLTGGDIVCQPTRLSVVTEVELAHGEIRTVFLDRERTQSWMDVKCEIAVRTHAPPRTFSESCFSCVTLSQPGL